MSKMLKLHKNTIVISERETYNFMSRVSKVFICSQAVFCDGSFLAFSGAYPIATSAKHFSVPLFLLSPLNHFTPLMTFDQRSVCPFISPFQKFPGANNKKDIEVQIPLFDVVPSSFVTMIISENDDYSPDYVYRVFSDFYCDNEYGYDFD